MRVDRVAHRVGSPVLARSTCATWPVACTPASVRPAPWTLRRVAAERRDRRRSTPCPTRLSPGAATDERRAVVFDRELIARHDAPQRNRARRDLRAAQKLLRLHRLLAGALHFEEPHRAVAARDRQPVVQHRAGRARAVAAGRAQHLDALGAAESRTRRRETARGRGNGRAPAFHGLRPVDARLALVDLGRVGDALVRLRRELQRPRSSAPSARTIRSAPSRASASCRSPAVMSGPIATRSAMRDRAGVEPSSIRITITPVSASPAMMARLIGAAPRQRGSSEACRLRQPSGAARGSASAGSARRRRRPPHRRVCARNAPAASSLRSVVGVSTGMPKRARLALDRARPAAPCRARRASARAYRPRRPHARARRSRPASAPRNRACP